MKTIKDIHLSPTEFFNNTDSTSIEGPAKFAGKVGLVFGAVLGLISILGIFIGINSPLAGIGGAIAMLIIFPIMTIISASIQSAFVHVALFVMGERGFAKTSNAVVYPFAATSLWSWIPVLNLVAGIYNLFLQVRGVAMLHDTTTGKALLAVLWPVILGTLILVLVFMGGTAASLA